MYEAARTITVFGGGALGSVAGPAGTALGGMAGGMVTDLAASIITDKPHGYVDSIGDMVKDVSHQQFPLESGVRTAATAVTDVAGGFAGAAIVNSGSVVSMSTLAYRTGRAIV